MPCDAAQVPLHIDSFRKACIAGSLLGKLPSQGAGVKDMGNKSGKREKQFIKSTIWQQSSSLIQTRIISRCKSQWEKALKVTEYYCWETIHHKFLVFLPVLQERALTAFVPEYLFKGYLYIPEHPWKVEIVQCLPPGQRTGCLMSTIRKIMTPSWSSAGRLTAPYEDSSFLNLGFLSSNATVFVQKSPGWPCSHHPVGNSVGDSGQILTQCLLLLL